MSDKLKGKKGILTVPQLESPPELKDFKITEHKNKSTSPDSHQAKGTDSGLWKQGMMEADSDPGCGDSGCWRLGI